jgi:hypothetical protein
VRPRSAPSPGRPPVRGSLPLPAAAPAEDPCEPVPDEPAVPAAEPLDEPCDGDCEALPDPPLLREDPEPPELLLP